MGSENAVGRSNLLVASEPTTHTRSSFLVYKSGSFIPHKLIQTSQEENKEYRVDASEKVDTSGIEPDTSPNRAEVLRERDNQLHHVPMKSDRFTTL
jgi:hypothetical protein